MGGKLFGQVTDATGLPKELITAELDRLVTNAGLDKDQLSLDDLRKILADYVQEVLVAAKDELDAK